MTSEKHEGREGGVCSSCCSVFEKKSFSLSLSLAGSSHLSRTTSAISLAARPSAGSIPISSAPDRGGAWSLSFYGGKRGNESKSGAAASLEGGRMPLPDRARKASNGHRAKIIANFTRSPRAFPGTFSVPIARDIIFDKRRWHCVEKREEKRRVRARTGAKEEQGVGGLERARSGDEINSCSQFLSLSRPPCSRQGRARSDLPRNTKDLLVVHRLPAVKGG